MVNINTWGKLELFAKTPGSFEENCPEVKREGSYCARRWGTVIRHHCTMLKSFSETFSAFHSEPLSHHKYLLLHFGMGTGSADVASNVIRSNYSFTEWLSHAISLDQGDIDSHVGEITVNKGVLCCSVGEANLRSAGDEEHPKKK